MQLGMIGLGRMGGNMVLRLLRNKHQCVAYDRDQKRTAEFDADEASRSDKATSVADLVKKLKAPRAVWVMLPAGEITENCIKELAGLLQPGDTVRVSLRVVEGERERIQAFEGVCIARKNAGINSNFTLRKISYGEGVERVFPLHSPRITAIEVVRRGAVRRAKREGSLIQY